MGSVIHITSSLVLVLLVTVSATGIRWSEHWCNDERKSTSILGKATPCEHALKEVRNSCPFHASKETEDKDCCDDRNTSINSMDQDAPVSSTVFVEVDFITGAFSSTSRPLVIRDLGGTFIKLRNHSPPPICSGLLSQYQTFLL